MYCHHSGTRFYLTNRGSLLKTDRTIPLELLDQNWPKFALKPPAWNEELLAEATTRRSQILLPANSLALTSVDPIEFITSCKSTNVTGNRLWSCMFCISSCCSLHRIQGWGVLRGACVSSSCTGTILLLLPHQCTEVLTQLHLTSWKTLRSAGSLCFTEGCVCVGLVLC